MEATPPGLRNLLQKCFQDTRIVKCDISSGSNPGDNVIGKMVSVKLTTGNGENHDLVVKAAVPFRNEGEVGLTHEEKLFSRVVSSFGFFQTELALYQRIQPKLIALQYHDFALPTPKIFFGQDDEENDGINACLILEDLRPKGYKMADKMKGLTMDEVIMVLEKIAKFHAASYVYLRNEQVVIDNEKDPLSTHIFDKVKTIGAEVVKSHKDFLRGLCFDMYELGKEKVSGELYQKITKFTQDPSEIIVTSSRQATRDFFPVVIHGDLWVNNILFKYDNQGRPVDVSFIDFQQCRYASVFDELHYFLYTSTTADFRKKNLQACLDLYYTRFQEALKSLAGQDTTISEFTQEKFQIGYRKYLPAAFCYGVFAIPFQVGIPPAETEVDFGSAAANTSSDKSVGENGTDNESASKNTSSQSGDNNNDELGKFIESTFRGMQASLIAAAKNSPVAHTRFGEFCDEMNQLNIFDLN